MKRRKLENFDKYWVPYNWEDMKETWGYVKVVFPTALTLALRWVSFEFCTIFIG